MTNFTPRIKRLNTGGQDQLKLGIALAKEGRLDEALSQFKAILKDDPTSMRANIGAGNIEFKHKRYDEALTYYQTAIRIDPLRPQPLLKAGKAYLRQGNLDKALEQFQSVITLDPKAIQAYAGSGQVLARQGKYEDAVQAFRKALRLDPRMVMIRLRLAQTYVSQEKFPDAISELKTAINIEPNKSITQAELGLIYLRHKEYGAAREALQRAIDLNPQVSAGIKLSLAEALIQENELEQAATILKDLSESKQKAPRLHKLWGDLYHRQGLHKEATEEYRAATLLASKGDTESEMSDSLDALEEQDDENWQELAESYRSAADSLVSERVAKGSNRRRRR